VPTLVPRYSVAYPDFAYPGQNPILPTLSLPTLVGTTLVRTLKIDDFWPIFQFKTILLHKGDKIWPNLGQIKVSPVSKDSKTKIKFKKFDQ
jgi:hypothetical protein